MSIDEYWKQQFEYLKSAPLAWALDADSLMRSFEIVAQQAEYDLDEKCNPISSSQSYVPQVGSNAMMLGALALECLLKGIALNTPHVQTAVQKQDQGIPKQLWSHNLCDIARVACIPLGSHEEELCKQLESFLKWAGRYSSPRQPKDMMPQLLNGGGMMLPGTYSSHDFSRIRNLAMRLRVLLQHPA